MRRIYVTTILSALLTILVFGAIRIFFQNDKETRTIKVGFVYESDESTPYTNNFVRAEKAVRSEYGDRIKVLVRSNVPEENGEEAVRDLVNNGCDVIFTTSYGYGETTKQIAGEYPEIQFCQATCADANEDPVYANYHNFMGEIYQGRYVAGIVAGLKLAEMIEQGQIEPSQAKVGYVGAFPFAEVISGYTAFLLGVRSVVPQAVMTVRYTDTWSSYTLEKKCAEKLIEEGCVIISQHSDTIGPAVACEEALDRQTVYHVGYNQSMIDVAPKTSLVSTRINWTPYIVNAVGAVLREQKIESCVDGNVHGNDVGAGFEKEWVQMMELNTLIAAEGTQDKIDAAVKAFK